jgi:hypothetical protein
LFTVSVNKNNKLTSPPENEFSLQYSEISLTMRFFLFQKNVMGFKCEKCCFCVELRVGCIVIGIVGLLLGITVVGLFPGISFLGGITFSLTGSACLIFAALNTKGSTHTRINAVWTYIGTRVSLLFIVILRWELIVANPYSGGWMWMISGIFNLYILLNVFCTLVAFIFYQQLKGENAKPHDKAELEMESKELRVTCIMIGLVKLLLGITVASLFPGSSLVDGSPFSLIGSSSLIFAAVNTKGSTQIRTNAIFLYIGTRILLVFIAILRWQLILTNPYSGSWVWNISGSSQLYILLNVFCSLIAVSFYQELKRKDVKPQHKSEQDIECKCVSSNVSQMEVDSILLSK